MIGLSDPRWPVVDAEVRELVEAGVDEEPSRGQASWTGGGPAALRWKHDGNDYAPTSLVRTILRQAAGSERGVRGPAWWVTGDGDDLVALADELASGEAAGSAVPRDWSDLHKLLAQLPEGRWTTYGDLAERIGSAAIAVGQHVTRCRECQGAWRILGSDRRPREGFRWSDPTRSDSARPKPCKERASVSMNTAAPTPCSGCGGQRLTDSGPRIVLESVVGLESACLR